MINFLWILLHPRYWVRNERTSKTLNDWCIEKLNDGTKFTNIDNYTANLDGKELWISNHPYNSFELRGISALPKRRTSYELMILLDKCRGKTKKKAIEEQVRVALYER
jgi:hypothetical protein